MKKYFILNIWIICFILFDMLICRGIFHLGYPTHYAFKGSAREPNPYVEFMREGLSPETSLDKTNFFKDAKKNDIKVALFGGSTGEPLSSKLFQEKLSKYMHQKVYVVNFSCISANHRQHLHMLLEVLPKYNPDIVIFYGGYNETVQAVYYDPRPGYPYNFFYRGELSPWKRFIIEHSALIGALEYKYNILSSLGKLQAEYKPLSAEWNKSIENKYFETMELSNAVTGTITSKKYGHTKFIGFYQPYQVKLVPEFMETNNNIRKKIKNIDYIYDVQDAYDGFDGNIWKDICHVKETSGANEHIIDIMSRIVAKKFKL